MFAVADNNGVVAPGDCLIMISFNDYSAGPNAEALARFLTKNDFPTFCTRIYCPANSGDWRDATEEGVANCKIYIPLVTKGWQMSTECQYETRLIRKRIADQNVKVIPVYYQDFDEDYDKATTGHNYKFKWNDFQSVYRQKGDEGKWMNKLLAKEEEVKWMKTILNLLAKEEDNSTSIEDETEEKLNETNNASRRLYTYDDLLNNSEFIEHKYSVKIGNDDTIAVVPSSDMIKITMEETKFEKYIDARRKKQFLIFPEELSAAKISLLEKKDCRKINPLQFIAMTEAQIEAFTSKQATEYFRGEKRRAISQIITCERGLHDVIHHFGTQDSKQSPTRIDNDGNDGDDSKKPRIGEDYSEYSKSSKRHVNYLQTSYEGYFHFRIEEYVWVRRSDGSISFGQVMNERASNRQFYFWTFTKLYQTILVWRVALFYQWVLPKATSLYQRAQTKAELLYSRVIDILSGLHLVSCQTITQRMENYFISASNRCSLLCKGIGRHVKSRTLARKWIWAGCIVAITLTTLIIKIVMEKEIEELEKPSQKQTFYLSVLQRLFLLPEDEEKIQIIENAMQ